MALGESVCTREPNRTVKKQKGRGFLQGARPVAPRAVSRTRDEAWGRSLTRAPGSGFCTWRLPHLDASVSRGWGPSLWGADRCYLQNLAKKCTRDILEFIPMNSYFSNLFFCVFYLYSIVFSLSLAVWDNIRNIEYNCFVGVSSFLSDTK